MSTLMKKTAAFSFLNKKALVTGASGGIGASIAKELAKQGAHVLIHYNTRYEGALLTKKHILDHGGVCDGIIQCDFRNPKNIIDMINVIDQENVWNGKIDILINNAGIVTKLAAEDDDDFGSAWLETIQVNLNAPYQLSKLAHKRMKKHQQGGVIINIGSIHGSISVEYMTAYAASKAGMDRMTANLANEWCHDNVRVNCIAPGVIPVERTEHILKQPASQEMWLPHLPSGRMGTADEIAHAVVFLCESEWSTGSILTVDGGMTSRANMPIRPRPIKPTSENKEKNGFDIQNLQFTASKFEK